MSGTWSGFSEDYIQKLKSNNGNSEVEKSRRIMKAKRQASQKNSIIINGSNNEINDPISEDAKLSKTEEITTQNPVDPKLEEKPIENTNFESKTPYNLITLNTCKIEKKVIDLEEFQARQKRIEEQNRKRKELLAKALADRTKQTEEEARRLKEIQNEFKKLDAILSDDVKILRHQIELASLDFMEAQKRYNKIEKEFLDAKLNLHQRLEKKEMLTEHLCAIIEKNEERKAEKLNELMNRLTIDGKTMKETFGNECDTDTKNSHETIIENSPSTDTESQIDLTNTS